MLTDRALLQQALDALEFAAHTTYSDSCATKFSDAIAALRHALAQPALQRLADADAALGLTYADGVPQAEAVGWDYADDSRTCEFLRQLLRREPTLEEVTQAQKACAPAAQPQAEAVGWDYADDSRTCEFLRQLLRREPTLEEVTQAQKACAPAAQPQAEAVAWLHEHLNAAITAEQKRTATPTTVIGYTIPAYAHPPAAQPVVTDAQIDRARKAYNEAWHTVRIGNLDTERWRAALTAALGVR
jgi:hypothetical protein